MRAVHLAVADERQHLLVDLRLFVINMHAVVGDEDSRRRSVAFGVDELVERVDGRQRRRLRLRAIFPCQRGVQIGALDLRAVLPRARKRVLQGDRNRLARARHRPENHGQGCAAPATPLHPTRHSTVQWTIAS